ncbi:BlaI/MecI/CopY family transcriptional regulator [Flaviflexus salsibiostraticola]|uniref:BlaI/MecI/CopY family transcriptional regulator n=1 Tax=Flaviflexus salsibiostraticola TaxID=1282737 RepID=A0A3Q8WWI2_9ACTO|nr:BlaI/MecI/CopY family transcriptional regulator [Flaviflexus salsibiostraticola]AZN30672.1 BlaI/MecI/CopY family transcriptional regulator [Flaviflexus salsibiostraticola]
MTEFEEPIRLGALEAQVMDVLWDVGPGTVRDIISHIASNPAYTTIATVLANLDRKGMVEISRSRRSTTYSAGMSRAEYEANQMACVLRGSRDRASSILHFVESMSETDRVLLRDFLTSKAAER